MEARIASRKRLRKPLVLGSHLWKNRYVYMLLLPGLLYFAVYKYLPLLGSVIAFQDYSPFRGFFGSDWVGLLQFRRIFEEPESLQVLRNTLLVALLQIVFYFPVPIILALMLNELRNQWLKRIIQSLVYMPYFISWVVVISIVTLFLRGDGIVNKLLQHGFGMEPISFMTDPVLFYPLLLAEIVWKESGWGSILFLAALAGVNPQLYEAAVVDGAGRWKQIWHITLPSIRGTIVVLLILRLGQVLDVGFEQIFLMLNPFTTEIGQVLDTYVYYKGVQQSDFSFATAVGLFKGVLGLALTVIANRIAKRSGEEGLY